MKFTRLSNLVNDTFTVQSVGRYLWKKWDDAGKRMLSSTAYEQGYSKKYPITTDKGTLDVGSGQLGNMLEGVLRDGEADLIGKTFKVKTNGKTGMDVRYFLDAVWDDRPATTQATPDSEPPRKDEDPPRDEPPVEELSF